MGQQQQTVRITRLGFMDRTNKPKICLKTSLLSIRSRRRAKSPRRIIPITAVQTPPRNHHYPSHYTLVFGVSSSSWQPRMASTRLQKHLCIDQSLQSTWALIAMRNENSFRIQATSELQMVMTDTISTEKVTKVKSKQTRLTPTHCNRHHASSSIASTSTRWPMRKACGGSQQDTGRYLSIGGHGCAVVVLVLLRNFLG